MFIINYINLFQIYCYGLNRRSQPKEFLSLPSGETENFSKISHKR